MSKTLKVSEALEYANKLLNNPKLSQEFKHGVCTMIEHTLHDTDNYGGFQYTYWAKQGYKEWKEAGEPGFPEKQKYLGLEYDRHYY